MPVLKLLENTAYQPEDIITIGNHGQTIRHRPDIDNSFRCKLAMPYGWLTSTHISEPVICHR